MGDPIIEMLSYILQGYFNTDIDPKEFEEIMTDYGFMIVPIEDPTNLRFGADE